MVTARTTNPTELDDSLLTRRQRRQRRRRDQRRRHVDLLPLLGIIPSFVLASYALTQPWAKARLLLVWGISRSPEAATLVIMALTGMVVSSVMVAFKSRRRMVTAGILVLTGFVMMGITGLAYRFVKRAGIKLLGILPISTVKPGPGLYLFLAASLLVVILGLVELAFSLWLRRSDARVSPVDAQ